MTEYGDAITIATFFKGKESTFALIRPDVHVHTVKIIDRIYEAGFKITRLKNKQ